MGFSCRMFIVHDDGTLVRLKSNIFDRLMRDPQHHSMPDMADKRVRMANILVELVNRRPIRVVRQTYFVAGFDQAGRLDAARFERQQLALVESALYPVFSTSNDDDRILDATSRFVAQGGLWRPPAELAQRIDDAALGRK